ncbi:flippase [Candidatus Woesearchaeota archaeon]|nr:flippase [Candidatus Woesearchaeota archaeon]
MTFEKVLRLGLMLFVYAWVARYLGPEQFGVLNYVIAFVALFSPLSKLGLDGIVVRNIVQEPAKKEEILGSATLMKLIGSVLMITFSVVVIGFLKADSMYFFFVAIVSFGYLFKSFDSIDLWFQSQVRSKYSVYARSIAFFIVSGLQVILILMNSPLVGFLLAFALDFLLATLGLLYYYIYRGNSLLKWKFDLKIIRNLLKDSWPLILSSVAVVIYMKIDQVMIGQMLGDTEVGLYAAAARISEAWYFIPVVISASIFPALIKAKNKGKKLYMQMMQKLFDIVIWISIVIALLMTFFSNILVTSLFGKEYIVASYVLSIHIWAGVFVFFGVANGKYLVNENLTKIALYKTILGAISNIILNIILIPKYGINGAALATLISYFISALLTNILFKKTRIILKMFLKSLYLPRVFRGFYG